MKHTILYLKFALWARADAACRLFFMWVEPFGNRSKDLTYENTACKERSPRDRAFFKVATTAHTRYSERGVTYNKNLNSENALPL